MPDSFPTLPGANRLAVMLLSLLVPSLLSAQGGGRDALAVFPSDTQQIVYSDLAQLRGLSNYPQIRQWIFNQQLKRFEDFLRGTGADPEQDVDEITLGWRGNRTQATTFFGLAEGRFDPDRTRNYFVRQNLPIQNYSGYDLFDFGTGGASLYFTYLDSSSAILGPLSDVKAMLDVRAGLRPALSTISDFSDGESEMEGTAPQWGMARGGAAANQAAGWLAGGQKLPTESNSVLAPVRFVLYRFDWANGFEMHLSMLCRDAAGAASLAQILSFLKAAAPASTAAPAMTAGALIQNLDITTLNNRVNAAGSVPLVTAEQIFRTRGVWGASGGSPSE